MSETAVEGFRRSRVAKRGRGPLSVRAWRTALAVVRTPAWLLTKALLLLIGLYRLVAPGLLPRCRFLPSCSEYAIECLRKHGLVRGLAKTSWRLLRCQPFCSGGYDPP